MSSPSPRSSADGSTGLGAGTPRGSGAAPDVRRRRTAVDALDRSSLPYAAVLSSNPWTLSRSFTPTTFDHGRRCRVS